MAKSIQQPVTIKKDEKNPEPMEIIANSIIEVSRGFQKFNDSKLNKRAILVLIKDLTGLPMGEIERVLNAAASLEKWFIKQK